ncbi:MAG: hypothetical protein HY423_00190 [Candidatus Lambdaproteobacteria bacterium]|nr:hypothetical protein [Candidatus Lambdaproteobacteria bacterium]
MAFLARLWRGFVRLFGLDTCPVPLAPARPATDRQQATRERLERTLRRP